MVEDKAVSENEVGLGDFNPLKVQVIDPKTRRVIESKPFRVHCLDGKRYYEYPKGSENLWFENRQFAGRLGKDSKGQPVAHESEPHVKWEPPKTVDESIAEQNAGLQAENAKLLAELAQIKKEQNDAAKAKAAQVAKVVAAAKPKGTQHA